MPLILAFWAGMAGAARTRHDVSIGTREMWLSSLTTALAVPPATVKISKSFNTDCPLIPMFRQSGYFFPGRRRRHWPVLEIRRHGGGWPVFQRAGPIGVRLRPHDKAERSARDNFLVTNPGPVERFPVKRGGLDVDVFRPVVFGHDCKFAPVMLAVVTASASDAGLNVKPVWLGVTV